MKHQQGRERYRIHKVAVHTVLKMWIIGIGMQLDAIAWVSAQDCRYQSYHDRADEAVLDFEAGAYTSANEKFRKAITQVPVPFGVHLRYALKTAALTHDTIWAEFVAEKLALGGIPLSYFDRFKGYSWYPEFSMHFSDYISECADSFDLSLKSQFLALCRLDSLVNDSLQLFRAGKIDMSFGQMIQAAGRVSDGFRAIVRQFGFPSGQNMGYHFMDGEVLSYPVVNLLTHIYQRGDLFYKDRLARLVCDGVLRPADQVTLSRIQGYGDSVGIEQSMRIWYETYRKKQ